MNGDDPSTVLQDVEHGPDRWPLEPGKNAVVLNHASESDQGAGSSESAGTPAGRGRCPPLEQPAQRLVDAERINTIARAESPMFGPPYPS